MADQLFLIFESQIAGRGPACNNERLRLEPFIIRFDANMIVARFEIGYLGVREAGAKFLRLLVHVQDKLRPVDSVWKSRIIFD